MKFITMTGMSRSGNHGIIRWIVSHYEESGHAVHFYNNTVVPFLEHINFMMPDVDKSTKKVLLVSLEDVAINERFSKMSSLADHNILLVRDPANLFASRIAGLGPDRGLLMPEGSGERDKMIGAAATSKALPNQVERYKNHYGEFCGDTNFLGKKVCISYNRWVVDEDYRRGIVESTLGLKFSDAKYKNRAGSSFGKPASSAEEYLDRWKTCWNNPIYAPIRNDDSLMDISRSFGVRLGEHQ
jgi:hypothetical protein